MNETLLGKWTHRSFRHDPIVIKDGKVEGTPQLAIPWAPAGAVEVTTDAAGKLSGKMTFAPGVVLELTGSFLPAGDKTPATLEVSGSGPVPGTPLIAVYNMKGYLLSGSD